MKKIPKAYRLNPGTIEQIQAIKMYYKSEGFAYSDANIIEKAVSEYMESVARVHRIRDLVEKGAKE